MKKTTNLATNEIDSNINWFFTHYNDMDKLEQIDYLTTYCGYSEESATAFVYGY